MAKKLRSPKDSQDDEPRRPGCRPVTQEDLEHINERLKKIMIAQATLDASLTALTNAVNAAVAALATSNTATSTPDTVVASYQAGVDAQTVALASATPPPVPPPAK